MSFSSRSFSTRWRLPIRLRWAVLAWLLAETVVFLAMVRVFGLGTTVLLGFATTLLGLALLRRTGTDTLRGLRRGLDGAGRPDGALLDTLLAGLGAVLLVIPGFLANAAGLVLAAPSARRAVARRFGALPGVAQPGRRAPDGVIDLSPEDWTPVDRR